MTPDRNHRDAAARTKARRTAWVFIAITILMAGLTLSLPYAVHRIRAASAHGGTSAAPTGVPAP